MSWRDVVTNWLSNKQDLTLLDLLWQLAQTNMIPATLIDNQTLQSILLTQIMLETLTDVTVPPAPQSSNFTYHMNAKEMVMLDLNVKNAKQMKMLEEQTGVNLDHYHKLNIENR